MAKLSEEVLLLCGTHAYKPKCRHYAFKVSRQLFSCTRTADFAAARPGTDERRPQKTFPANEASARKIKLAAQGNQTHHWILITSWYFLPSPLLSLLQPPPTYQLGYETACCCCCWMDWYMHRQYIAIVLYKNGALLNFLIKQVSLPPSRGVVHTTEGFNF